MSRRRSTVYDAAALRLHPSGVRVRPTPGKSSRVLARSTNAKQAVSGDWIATDAGGDGKITKRRKMSADEQRETNSPVNGDVAIPGSDEQVDLEASATPKVLKDVRSQRRLAFKRDFSFLSTSSVHNGEDNSAIRPSADFLKCIHYFSSHYYGMNGQIFDSAKEYRKKKSNKRRKRQAMQAKVAKATPESEDNSQTDEEEDAEESDDVGKHSSPSPDRSKGKQRADGPTKPRKARLKDDRKDMYKAFDGSALLCIGWLHISSKSPQLILALGMFLQAHVASTLSDKVPPDWETELQAYEGAVKERSDFKALGSPIKRTVGPTTRSRRKQKSSSHSQSPQENGDEDNASENNSDAIESEDQDQDTSDDNRSSNG
ncbi:hypothetical protein M422DRAFT_238825 [Sphaerobolus stellatus SS14]|nr:hypothetical protein M422DRAFT_238825 [Sphaerobolus stellatus SS14]